MSAHIGIKNLATEYAFADATLSLQNLAEKAGTETRKEALAAETLPVSKLKYTASCQEATAEYYRAYHEISSIANVLDYQKIKTHYKPEVVVLINPPIWIRPDHTAVVIPLLQSGNPKITVKGPQSPKWEPRQMYDVTWQPGSVHYLGGNVSLDISGNGRIVFIFLLFKMAVETGDVDGLSGDCAQSQ